jgi:thioredoxin-related protein
MITYFLKEDANHIGDRDDPEMQRLEIQEYVKDYLYNPNRQNSIIREEFLKYFDKKKSMNGRINEDEISNIVDYLFEYEEKREKKKGISKLKSVSIDKILNEAKREKKLVMIEAISKTCYYCEKMERDVLSKSDIKSAIQKDFVYKKVDIDKETLPLDLQKYYKKITPSFFVLDASGKLLNSYPGSWTKEDFFEIMRENIK